MKEKDGFPAKTRSFNPIPGYLIVLVMLIYGCGPKKPVEEKTKALPYITDSVYIRQGNNIVALTFDTLRNSLLNAISTQGIEGAILFCNEKANSITTHYADRVLIRRTSLRVRNANNKPDSIEMLMLTEMEQIHQSSATLQARVVRQPSTGEIHFFKPILLQAMCLNCHGTTEVDIQPSTLARIKNQYPDDQAVNYKTGDLRGVWHIIFKDNR